MLMCRRAELCAVDCHVNEIDDVSFRDKTVGHPHLLMKMYGKVSKKSNKNSTRSDKRPNFTRKNN